MPNFKYLAYDTEGKEVTGTLAASTGKEAVEQLRTRGLYVKTIHEDVKKKFRLEKGMSLADLFLNLSSMISAGVLVPDAVKSLTTETHGQLREVMDEVYNDLVKGLSFSGAMEQRKDFFPTYIYSMVRAGEESGSLDRVLKDLADFLQREKDLKNRVTSSMIYPAFMIAVAALIIFFVLVFVFPRVTVIFQEQKVRLPFITIVFMGVSTFFMKFWYLVIGCAVAGFFFLRRTYRRKRGEIHKYIFYSPVKVFRNLYVTRFCRMLGLLLGGGVPVLKALDYSREVTGNDHLMQEIERVRNDVREGRKLSDVITFLPPTYLQMIITGEKTGNLTESLTRISVMAENDFRRSVDNFLRVLEPSIILFMGVMVLLMVLSILLPIFEMNQIIR